MIQAEPAYDPRPAALETMMPGPKPPMPPLPSSADAIGAANIAAATANAVAQGPINTLADAANMALREAM